MDLEINEKEKNWFFQKINKIYNPLAKPRYKIQKPGMKTSPLTPTEIRNIVKYTMKNFMPAN